MPGALLYDNIECMQMLVEIKLIDIARRKELSVLIDAVVEYMKFHFSGQIGSDSDCVHDTVFALQWFERLSG